MRPCSRALIVALALLTTLAPGAGAQASEHLLDEVKVLTPHALADLVSVAESGDTVAQFKVGLAYYYGYAVKAMPTEAARWFRRAADRGCVAAQHMLGVQLRDGNGVDQNTGEAQHLLRAAERGYPDAQYDYGLMLFDGNGVEQNYPEAYNWFSKAAAQGSVGARTFVGIMLVNGLGVDANPSAGADALRQAARAGSPMAQANLGALYANGVGVAPSVTEALVWFFMAEAAGFEEVGPLIAEMTLSMSESEVTELRREAQQRAQRILAGAADEARAEDETPRMGDADLAAALRALDEWFGSRLTELGTFTFGIRSDAARARSEDELKVTLRGRHSLTEASLDGCRLHWATTTVLPLTKAEDRVDTRSSEPSQLDWFVDLEKVDPARLQVLPWEVHELFRVVSGQIYAVYLRPPLNVTDSYFLVVDSEGRTSGVFEVAIPLRDRRDAEEVMEKLFEGVQLCARR